MELLDLAPAGLQLLTLGLDLGFQRDDQLLQNGVVIAFVVAVLLVGVVVVVGNLYSPSEPLGSGLLVAGDLSLAYAAPNCICGYA